MDIYFDIDTEKGSLIRVALSCYDLATMQYFTTDPGVLALNFYDVSMYRVGDDYGSAGQRALNAVSRTLASFLIDNDDVVLCFYCDESTDVARHNQAITPQEYRSRLFSAMFDRYVHTNKLVDFVNYIIRIENGGQPHFAHLICRETHLSAAKKIGELLMDAK